jgi:hypothetical protein
MIMKIGIARYEIISPEAIANPITIGVPIIK